MVKVYSKDEINKLIDILNNDGVISVPTDTVYGICTKISSIKGYKKLLDIKKRPKEKLFPIMCYNKEDINSIAYLNIKAEKIIDNLMPGPITIILRVKDNILKNIESDTIAVRLAPTEELKKIIKELGPVFMTSANISGRKTCENIEEIKKECPNLDGILKGKIKFKEASTIVDCTSDIKILRSGPIDIEKINSVL